MGSWNQKKETASGYVDPCLLQFREVISFIPFMGQGRTTDPSGTRTLHNMSCSEVAVSWQHRAGARRGSPLSGRATSRTCSQASRLILFEPTSDRASDCARGTALTVWWKPGLRLATDALGIYHLCEREHACRLPTVSQSCHSSATCVR